MAKTGTRMAVQRKWVDAETFIREWQTAESVAEFCEKTGMREGSARTRATTLRKRGIPLKMQDRNYPTARLDVDALTKLAKSLAA